MDINKIEELLKEISFKMLEYEEGDLMLLSDLIDSLMIFTDMVKDYENVESILKIITGVCCVSLKGTVIENIEDIFSMGIDIIYKIIKKIKNTGAKDTDIYAVFKNEIDEFLADYSGYVEECGKDKKAIQKLKEKVKPGSFIRLNSETLKIFIVEAEERIINAQEMVLTLEEDPENIEILNNLFRIFHTIKGECGFLKLSSLAELAHNIENLLDLLRNKKIEYDDKVTEILLNGIDYAKQMIAALSSGDVAVYNKVNISSFLNRIKTRTREKKPVLGEILEKEGKISETETEIILKKQKDEFYTKKFGEIAVEDQYISKEELTSSLEKQGTGISAFEYNKADPIIKVKASQINFLVDMIGELIICENQLDETNRNVIQLKKITKELL